MNKACRRCQTRPSVRTRSHGDVTDLWKNAIEPFVVESIELCHACRSDASVENAIALSRRTLNAPRFSL